MRFVLALIGTNLKAALALRGAFWMQAAFMMLNNLIFFTFWWLAYQQIDSIGGWRLPEICVLYGTVSCAFGVTSLLFGGVRELSQTISDGKLDLFLTQPKSVLLQSIAGRSYPSGWGDIVSAAILIAWSGYLDGWNWVVIPALIAGATVALTATGILIHSVAFWAGPVHTLARQLWEYTITTSVYPASIYGGTARWLFFLILPSAFVSQLPVELVRAPTWEWTIAWLGGTFIYALAAVAVFHRGLKIYTSGNRFTARV